MNNSNVVDAFEACPSSESLAMWSSFCKVAVAGQPFESHNGFEIFNGALDLWAQRS